jgi:hypothetical protein
MLDLSHIPNSQQDVQIFYSNGVTNAWQTWNKPRKCNYVWIMCIGGAGGGGGGAGSYNTLGGSGGGSGAITRVMYNAQQLPDILYIQVGLGGAGGAGATTSGVNGSTGSPGNRSFVSLQPAVVAQNLVAASGNGAAAGGAGGTGGATAAESVSTQASTTFYTLGNFISTNGQAAPIYPGGAIWNTTPFTSTLVSAGAGGSISINGSGNILSSSLTPQITGGGYAANGNNGGNGANGITSFKPFFSTGGAGGGAALLGTTGNGGNGGNGGIGSGGGGGGSADVSVGVNTGGRGGRGGDGLVVIISF